MSYYENRARVNRKQARIETIEGACGVAVSAGLALAEKWAFAAILLVFSILIFIRAARLRATARRYSALANDLPFTP